MRGVIACLLVVLLATAGRAHAVVGGVAADPGRWGFVVPLLDAPTADPYQAQFCAGSLVAPSWVLTAAHCVEGGSWCQTAATGHRIRVDVDVRKPSRRLFFAIVRGRTTGLCSHVVVVRRPDSFPPGRYFVYVKVIDQSTRMATPTPELLRGFLTIRR